VALAVEHAVRPDDIVTVFAGQDVEATARARSYFAGYRASSPAIAVLQDGEVAVMLERHQIEGRSVEAIAAELTAAFDQFCGANA
jgi:putative YphP/YqiW family bacilliredoxin